MSKTFNGSIDFTSNFNVQTTKPLDNRLVVDSIEDLTNGSIEAPYQGMVVNIAGTSELWILKTAGIANSHISDNWELVTGSSSGTSEEVEEKIQEIRESLGVLTDVVGTPRTETENPTGIFEEIEELKKTKTGFDNYSIPIMTPAQRIAALSDPASGYTEDTDFIPVDLGDSDSDYDLSTPEGRRMFVASIDYNYSSLTGETANRTVTSVDGTYLDIMMSAIKRLQAEITQLKQIFDGGIHSYINKNTAKSQTLLDYEKEPTDEPLWSLDAEDGGLTYVVPSDVFNYELDTLQNVFVTPGLNDSISFPNEGTAIITGKADLHDNENTLLSLTDSKLITYIVSDNDDIDFELVNVDVPNRADILVPPINIKNLVNSTLGYNFTCNTYAITFIVSRKVKINGVTCSNNYVYVSVMNFENNSKIVEGYLKPDGTLGFNNGTTTRYDLNPDKVYSINRIRFYEQTLYRLRFYTKYQDFSHGVVPSNPIEEQTKYKYNTAHITIRSVKNMEMLNEIKEDLHYNELVWVEESKKLMIKASNGEVYTVGAGKNDDDNNNDDNMTRLEIAQKLVEMGIVIDAEFNEETGEIISLNNIKLNDISSFTMINAETDKKFTFTVDPYGNLVGKDMSDKSIEDLLREKNIQIDFTAETANVRGFSANYFTRMYTAVDENANVPNTGKLTYTSDRIRISSFYAPLETDTVHGCSHSFVELENSSPYDFPLKGVYLHFYNPGAIYNSATDTYSGKVYHLALDGVLKAGSTYLVRGAQHVERMDDANCFIKVNTYDKEWYDENGKLVSFEQLIATATPDGKNVDPSSKVKESYRFCLTYGLPNLEKDQVLVMDAGTIKDSSGNYTIATGTYSYPSYPTIFKNAGYIDGCGFSNLAIISGVKNGWFNNGPKGGSSITIVANSMYRIMFALDPAKQAFNGFTTDDSSRTRYNKATDINIVKLNEEFIGFPNSDEVMPISRYTPKASFENKNVITDKTQLDFEKPNMPTCSLGIDVYNTRCFNWVSCGLFDEFVWMRKPGETKWTKFESYKKVTSRTAEKDTAAIYRKEFNVALNNAAYARITNRFPGNDVQFTSHKCIVRFKDYVNEPTTYEYVVGRADKDGNPDPNHTSDLYTFTLYPTSYEGRLYQITDQQGFHWVEYQVWAAAANSLDDTIGDCKTKGEIKSINDEIEAYNQTAEAYNTQHAEEIGMDITEAMPIKPKVFPILLNTGDMTQSGCRINEWLDYYNGGKKLFSHLEQMNCVGNNDLCGLDPRDLGTGNDSDKSNSLFFHYFYCFEVDDNDNLIVHPHTGKYVDDQKVTKNVNLTEDLFIPSTYYFKTMGVLYIVVNSEITKTTCEGWYGLTSSSEDAAVNIYTGIEMTGDGKYDKTTSNFTPIYETLYSWFVANRDSASPKKVIVAMHEMPFTVITQQSLTKSNSEYMKSTRNHPTAAKSRVGSNTNQLAKVEKRGIYWCSRLLEYFGCKLVIGGHKHTYALSYPIKEKYTWTYNGVKKSSLEEIKPMFSTLADEAVQANGDAPVYDVNWLIPDNDPELQKYYNDDTTTYSLNTTKTPYIPYELYSVYGEGSFGSAEGIFRCCTPIKEHKENEQDPYEEYAYNGDKFDGFVTYSMCQATGYKLKSNKELPSSLQVFSKIIPQTTNGKDEYGNNSDTPHPNQLYPMYSVIEINYDNDGIDNINVRMRRVTNIFKANGGDKFAQGAFGKSKPGMEELYSTIDMDSLTLIPNNIDVTQMADSADIGKIYKTNDGKIYECITNDEGDAYWHQVVMDMYGYWTNKATGTYLNIKY